MRSFRKDVTPRLDMRVSKASSHDRYLIYRTSSLSKIKFRKNIFLSVFWEFNSNYGYLS